jgi:octaprenyl-diphosphate synthase
VRNSGGLEYAQDAMYRFREEAFELLKKAPESEARTALKELVTFVTDRKK